MRAPCAAGGEAGPAPLVLGTEAPGGGPATGPGGDHGACICGCTCSVSLGKWDTWAEVCPLLSEATFLFQPPVCSPVPWRKPDSCHRGFGGEGGSCVWWPRPPSCPSFSHPLQLFSPPSASPTCPSFAPLPTNPTLSLFPPSQCLHRHTLTHSMSVTGIDLPPRTVRTG